jgi:hypothetical protein
MSKECRLTYHGRSKEVCEYVVHHFDKPEYSYNKTISMWLQASKQYLKEIQDV